MKKAANDKNLSLLLPRKDPGDWLVSDFIGVSSQAREVREQLEWLAAEPDAKCILITGESGVGKDLAAKILQSTSVNVTDKKNFVHVNCGEFEKEHVHSELFGHRKGSFTGSIEERKGCFRAAENGALFLNEIGNIDLSIQSKLLHVLDENKVKPLGFDKEIEVNPLIIFATNADLKMMVEQGLFRNDLLQRMQCIQLHIPPLRERKQDIPLMIDFLYRNMCSTSLCGIKPSIDKGVYDLLAGQELKGNVREIANKLRAAFGQMRRNNDWMLRPSHFYGSGSKPGTTPLEEMITEPYLKENVLQQFRLYLRQSELLNHTPGNGNTSGHFDLPGFIADIQTVFLQESGGNKARAAQRLKINRKHFYSKKPDKPLL